MNLIELSDVSHENATRLGKIEGRTDIEKLKDLQLEYMEALKALNDGHFADWNKYHELLEGYGFEFAFERTIKDSYEDELVDMLFVVLTLMKDRGMAILKHILFKIKYNKLRKGKV